LPVASATPGATFNFSAPLLWKRLLRLANGRRDEVGVNADPKESNLDVIPDDVLALWVGKGGQSSQEASAPGQPVSPAAPSRTAQSLWWYVMLLVLAAALAESVLASRYLGTLRQEDDVSPKSPLKNTLEVG